MYVVGFFYCECQYYCSDEISSHGNKHQLISYTFDVNNLYKRRYDQLSRSVTYETHQDYNKNNHYFTHGPTNTKQKLYKYLCEIILHNYESI